MAARKLLTVAAAFLCLGALGLCGSLRSVLACSIPVFRYALEHWPVEPYTVIVFHRGVLEDGHGEIVDRLRDFSREAGSPVEVTAVDVSGELEEPLRSVYEAGEAPGLPWMVLCYPGRPSVGGIVWSGRLSAVAARALLQSPARAEMARRIAGGDAAVWVLLECGDREKDEAAFAVLESELREMETTLELPPGFAEQYADGEGGPELRVSFSVLRVSRETPAEQMLVRMLLRSERDLTTPKYAAEPMAFPVFGRGRVLYALVGKGINERNIWRASGFLVGPCSCQVQSASPGTQLLISADWEGLVTGTLAVDEALPPLAGLPEFAPPAGEVDRDSAGAAGAATAAGGEPTERSGALRRNVLIVVLIGLAVAAAGTLVLRRRRN